tara:strand:- start:504 stop:650 length:147 start_codon:yes stop_codon:yes gene_type:complete
VLGIATAIVIGIGYKLSTDAVTCRDEMATIHAEMTTITDKYYLFPKEP